MDAVPEGLAGSDWKSIRQVYEQNRHAVVAVSMAVDGAFRARNPGQQWLTHFDGRGFVVNPDGANWQWGLELQSYGFPGHQRSINGQANMTADNNRVTYDWHEGLQEWFVNGRSGLEHGFTLTSRPAGAGDPQLGASNHLEFRLAVRGGLLAKAYADGLGASFVNGQGSTVVNYVGLKVWDADKRLLSARLEADATGLRLTVDERNARYPLTIDPIAQQAYLKASNTEAGDNFGLSVAVSGNTVVIGADGEASNAAGVDGNQSDDSANYAGAAYVFVRDSGGVWSQQAYLKASNTEAGDLFGQSVDVSGDTVVVGAYLEASNATGVNGSQADNSATESGSAYVFVRDSGGVWSQQAYLKASNTDAGDRFGRTVAVSDDTVVVGAQGEASNAVGVNGDQADNIAIRSGAAYVFVRDSGGVWSQQGYLKASNTDGGDRFGKSVAVSGDTVVVGAQVESSNATGVNGNQGDNSVPSSGAAYVFVRDTGGVWSQQAYLKASNTAFRDFFGHAVAVSGDKVVVGAMFEDSSAVGVNGDQADNSAGRSGSAYVFVRDSGDVWSQQTYLKASNTGAGDQFGQAVALSGDTVVVGAFLEESNATGVNGDQTDNSVIDSGATYIFLIPSVCGDGVVEQAEECDDGLDNSDTQPDACRTDCSAASCGDGVIDSGEQCDDGNTQPNDGCDETCVIELGACCQGTVCNISTESDCLGAGGGFFGPDTTCNSPDADGDGLRDECDACPNDPNKIQPGICGCNRDDFADSDNDGVPDCDDQCLGADDSIFAPDCVGAIPTVSEWGLVVLTLLLLISGKLYFGRRSEGPGNIA